MQTCLKIEVTHGVKLKIPLANKIILQAMQYASPDQAIYYAAGELPLTATATVRMQNEPWENSEIRSAETLAQTQAVVGQEIADDFIALTS